MLAPRATASEIARVASERMTYSPVPVAEAAAWREAELPAPGSGVSPTRPTSFIVTPPVEVAAASTPPESTAAAPTVPPAYSGWSLRKRRIFRLCLPSTSSRRLRLSCQSECRAGVTGSWSGKPITRANPRAPPRGGARAARARDRAPLFPGGAHPRAALLFRAGPPVAGAAVSNQCDGHGLLRVDRITQANVQLAQLLLGDRARRFHHEVLAALRLREGDHVADLVDPGHQC